LRRKRSWKPARLNSITRYSRYPPYEPFYLKMQKRIGKVVSERKGTERRPSPFFCFVKKGGFSNVILPGKRKEEEGNLEQREDGGEGTGIVVLP